MKGISVRKHKKKFVFLLVTLLTLSSIISIFSGQILAQQTTLKFNTYDAEVNLQSGVLTMNRWDGESYLKYGLPTAAFNSKSTDENFVRFDNDGYHINIYERYYPVEGIEYEFVIYQNPYTNTFTIPIESKNLEFLYQPPLDEELDSKDYDSLNSTHAIKDGIVDTHRPENIVGSYAVYHTSKTGNEYKAGKAFHIYRPKVIDDNENEVWAELNIENGNITITVPQDFLEKATYPVTVDPTFGYTSEGGSSSGIGDDIRGSWFTVPKTTTATSITAYLFGYSSGPLSIYEEATTYPDNKKMKELQVGDYILGYDEEKEEVVMTEVTKNSFGYKECIKVNDLILTNDHPVYTSNGWVPAGELEIGDKVLSLDGFVTVNNIEEIGVRKVYHPSTSPTHNFFVDDILVHNAWYPYKFAIYDKDSDDKIGETEEKNEGEDGVSDWYTCDITSGGSLSEGDDVYLVAWSDIGAGDEMTLYYDSDTGKGAHDGESYNGFPDPWSPSSEDRKYSIYCTYPGVTQTHTFDSTSTFTSTHSGTSTSSVTSSVSETWASSTTSAATSLTTSSVVTGSADWTNPTGHTDTDGRWYQETSAYDGDTGTYAYNYYASGNDFWGGFIEFSFSEITSTKVKLYLWRYSEGSPIDAVDIDVYDSSWRNVYQGSFSDNVWTEKSFVQRDITKVRVRFHYPSYYQNAGYIGEIEVWEINAGVGTVTQNVDTTEIWTWTVPCSTTRTDTQVITSYDETTVTVEDSSTYLWTSYDYTEITSSSTTTKFTTDIETSTSDTSTATGEEEWEVVMVYIDPTTTITTTSGCYTTATSTTTCSTSVDSTETTTCTTSVETSQTSTTTSSTETSVTTTDTCTTSTDTSETTTSTSTTSTDTSKTTTSTSTTSTETSETTTSTCTTSESTSETCTTTCSTITSETSTTTCTTLVETSKTTTSTCETATITSKTSTTTCWTSTETSKTTETIETTLTETDTDTITINTSVTVTNTIETVTIETSTTTTDTVTCETVETSYTTTSTLTSVTEETSYSTTTTVTSKTQLTTFTTTITNETETETQTLTSTIFGTTSTISTISTTTEADSTSTLTTAYTTVEYVTRDTLQEDLINYILIGIVIAIGVGIALYYGLVDGRRRR